MLLEVTLTSKGQITLPKAVRDRLQAKAGSKIRFVIRDEGIFIELPEKHSVLDWYGAVKVSKPQDLKKVREKVHELRGAEVVREMSGD